MFIKVCCGLDIMMLHMELVKGLLGLGKALVSLLDETPIECEEKSSDGEIVYSCDVARISVKVSRLSDFHGSVGVEAESMVPLAPSDPLRISLNISNVESSLGLTLHPGAVRDLYSQALDTITSSQLRERLKRLDLQMLLITQQVLERSRIRSLLGTHRAGLIPISPRHLRHR